MKKTSNTVKISYSTYCKICDKLQCGFNPLMALCLDNFPYGLYIRYKFACKKGTAKTPNSMYWFWSAR